MADSNPPRKGGVRPESTFPNQMEKQGKTIKGKLILEKGYTVPGFEQGGGGSLTPEYVQGAPMKDTPHPHTGEDITGEY